MGFRTAILLACTVGLLVAGEADNWRQQRAAVVKSFQGKDYATMRELLLKQHAEFPGVRGTLYNLALAEALLGHTKAAIDWLKKFADSGLDLDPRKDPNLASLLDSPQMAAIERQMERNRAPVSHATTFFYLSRSRCAHRGSRVRSQDAHVLRQQRASQQNFRNWSGPRAQGFYR